MLDVSYKSIVSFIVLHSLFIFFGLLIKSSYSHLLTWIATLISLLTLLLGIVSFLKKNKKLRLIYQFGALSPFFILALRGLDFTIGLSTYLLISIIGLMGLGLLLLTLNREWAISLIGLQFTSLQVNWAIFTLVIFLSVGLAFIFGMHKKTIDDFLIYMISIMFLFALFGFYFSIISNYLYDIKLREK